MSAMSKGGMTGVPLLDFLLVCFCALVLIGIAWEFHLNTRLDRENAETDAVRRDSLLREIARNAREQREQGNTWGRG